MSRSDTGTADALNQAFQAARGNLIGWLTADDLYPRGALGRAVSTLDAHPYWLVVYRERFPWLDSTQSGMAFTR